MAAGQEQLTHPSIEGYRIVRLIGSGGMGLVYEAVHEGDGFQHRVALKLIRHGMDSDRALRRFRQERQLLARLQHPNIATLLDGGITDDGQPYLVIEYVDGTPLLSYCDTRRLGLRERIDLLLQIASAVGTAHQNLIVHRDLKPANVLVTPAGETKLLDFGIATLLRDSGDSGPATDAGARAYTPEYASPELIRGDPVTVAADVYALGVTACELLAGARPFVRGELSVTAFEQIVLNGEPPRPSSLVNETAARNRRESLTSLQRALRGELDNIILMALHQDVDRRYPSVEALADDLRRYLKGQPVAAQPDRLAYRARKFIGRNRAVVGLSALVAALLIGGIAVATDQARRADAAARAAERERSRAEAVSSFLVEMFAAPDSGPSGRPVTVVETLDRAAEQAGPRLASQPELERAVRATLGHSFLSLGKYDDARREFTRAAELATALGGRTSDDALAARNNIGTALQQAGDWRGADSVWRGIVTELAGQDRRDSLYATILGNLGTAESQLGLLREGEERQRAGVAIWRSIPGDHSLSLVHALNNLGVSLGRQQRWAAAESLHREAYGIARAQWGRGHAVTVAALNGLAGALDLQDRLAEADSAYREVLDIRRELLGSEHPEYLFTLFNYAAFLLVQDRCVEAVTHAREVLEHRGTTLAESHPGVASSLQTVGRCLDRLPGSDRNEAGRALAESLDLRRKHLPADHWLVLVSESVYGEHLGLVGRFREAEPLLVHAHQGLVTQFGAESPRVREAAARLTAFRQRAAAQQR